MATRLLRNDPARPAVLFLLLSCHVLFAVRPALTLCLVTSSIHNESSHETWDIFGSILFPLSTEKCNQSQGQGHGEQRQHKETLLKFTCGTKQI